MRQQVVDKVVQADRQVLANKTSLLRTSLTAGFNNSCILSLNTHRSGSILVHSVDVSVLLHTVLDIGQHRHRHRLVQVLNHVLSVACRGDWGTA